MHALLPEEEEEEEVYEVNARMICSFTDGRPKTKKMTRFGLFARRLFIGQVTIELPLIQ